MKLLIVEDNIDLAVSILAYLRNENFVCEHAATYAEASEKVNLYEYDVLILDLGLPDASGLGIIEELKKKDVQTGILIVSAKDALEDKLLGLEMGADDYITKPFHLAELNARIRSLIRRNHFGGKQHIQIKNMLVDLQAQLVKVDDQELNLTRKEYELLLYFVYNRNRVLTKENIAEHLWDDNIDLADNFDFIYTHIKNLRKKILNAGGTDHIKSVYGMGYRFVTDVA